MNSVFCAEVSFGRGSVAMMVFRGTMGYPARHSPSLTKLVPSGKYSSSGSLRGWSAKSCQLGNAVHDFSVLMF